MRDAKDIDGRAEVGSGTLADTPRGRRGAGLVGSDYGGGNPMSAHQMGIRHSSQ